MDIKFVKGVTANVPVESLIDIYQTMLYAFETQNWEDVAVALDCLATDISQYTEATDKVGFKPSPSSVIAGSVSDGLVCDANGGDITCAAGNGVSSTMDGSCCQCSEECMAKHGCDPEHGRIKLSCGEYYAMGAGIHAEERLFKALSQA